MITVHMEFQPLLSIIHRIPTGILLGTLLPFIGSNSVNAGIVSSSTSVNDALFKSLDDSDITSTSKVLTVDGTKYTFTVSIAGLYIWFWNARPKFTLCRRSRAILKAALSLPLTSLSSILLMWTTPLDHPPGKPPK